MTASTSTTGSMRRSGARRCHPVPYRRPRRPTRFRRAHLRWDLRLVPWKRRSRRRRLASGRKLAQRGTDTAGRTASRRRCRPRCAERVQRQRGRRSVGCGRALRPTHGRVHDARRTFGAAAESGRRRSTQVVEGPAPDLTLTAVRSVRLGQSFQSERAPRCRGAC